MIKATIRLKFQQNVIPTKHIRSCLVVPQIDNQIIYHGQFTINNHKYDNSNYFMKTQIKPSQIKFEIVRF